MIISFSVKNYKSFRDEHTLNFNVGKIDGIHPSNMGFPQNDNKVAILRSAGIWGANASGKSNLLSAFEDLVEFVIISFRYGLDDSIPMYKPFELDETHNNEPVYFELEFFGLDNLRYTYSLEIGKDEVISESLYYYASSKPSKLFDRKKGSEQSSWFGSKLDGTKAISCLKNQSYISVAAQNENSSEKIKNIYRFFRNNVILQMGLNLITPTSNMLKNEQYRRDLTKLLACADTGIKEVGFEEYDLSTLNEVDGIWATLPEKFKQEFVERERYRPTFKQGECDRWLSLSDQSVGTKRLYEIAPFLLTVFRCRAVLVIDELDNNLHPHMVEIIIRLFHDKSVNKNNSQLIFTSHNYALMSSELFRKEQVYFTQKDVTGATELFSLYEFNDIRENTNFEKWYNEGRFEAFPRIQYSCLRELFQSKGEEDA